jgi:hypothetical protein
VYAEWVSEWVSVKFSMMLTASSQVTMFAVTNVHTTHIQVRNYLCRSNRLKSMLNAYTCINIDKQFSLSMFFMIVTVIQCHSVTRQHFKWSYKLLIVGIHFICLFHFYAYDLQAYLMWIHRVNFKRISFKQLRFWKILFNNIDYSTQFYH